MSLGENRPGSQNVVEIILWKVLLLFFFLYYWHWETVTGENWAGFGEVD